MIQMTTSGSIFPSRRGTFEPQVCSSRMCNLAFYLKPRFFSVDHGIKIFLCNRLLVSGIRVDELREPLPECCGSQPDVSGGVLDFHQSRPSPAAYFPDGGVFA